MGRPVMWKEWEMGNWSGKRCEDKRNCDGRTALRESWKEREKIGEQEKNTNGTENVDREFSERKVRSDKRKKKTETMANLTPDYRDANRGTPTI